jgi:hypothetical protein
MDSVIVGLLIALPLGGFGAGVYFQKYVISEAASIKQHVTDEVAELRADVASLLDKVKAKL